MRIGLDFDNTIVSYDWLFHKVAFEQGHIPASLAKNKLAVRNYLREHDQEPVWMQMQGYVYGARMQEAKIFEDAAMVIADLKKAGHELFIISHRAQTPHVGPNYDLHAAALAWIATHLRDKNTVELIAPDNVYFHETKDEKIARIGERCCDIFLDDLPEILLHKNFPAQVKRVLFSPEVEDSEDWEKARSWSDFADIIRRGFTAQPVTSRPDLFDHPLRERNTAGEGR